LETFKTELSETINVELHKEVGDNRSERLNVDVARITLDFVNGLLSAKVDESGRIIDGIKGTLTEN
jgi:hypothetical protein